MRTYEAFTYPTVAPSPCMASSPPYVPTPSWNTCSRTWTSHISIFFRCTYAGSIILAAPTELLSYSRTWLQQRGGLSPRPTLWGDSDTCASLQGCTQEILISTSPACSGTVITKTPIPINISLPPLASLWQPQKQPTPPVISPSALLTLSRLTCSSIYALGNIPKCDPTDTQSSFSSSI